MIDNQALGLLAARAMEKLEQDEDSGNGKITNAIMAVEVFNEEKGYFTFVVPAVPWPSAQTGILHNAMKALEGRWGNTTSFGSDDAE